MKKYTAFAFLLLCVIMITACSTVKDKAPATLDSVEDSNINSDKYMVSTPYADICLPTSFQGNVKTNVLSEEPYVLQFCSIEDDEELFELSFGGKTENLVGTLKLSDKNVVIYANFAMLDETNKNYSKYCEYREGINTIIENLVADYDFVVNQEIEYEDVSTFDIKTSVTTLKYPNKWKDKVDIDISDNGVKFSNDGTSLFDLIFSENSDGYLLGTYNETPIYIVNYEAETDEQAQMLEDVNVILQNLIKDSNFKINY